MIRLEDAESALTLFTEGIAGRYYHIKAAAEFNSRRVLLGPEDVALTQDTVYLPESIPYEDPAAYRVLTLEQLGYREFGSFEFSIAQARRQLPELAALSAPEVTVRESDFALLYRHVEFPGLLQRLHSSCERARVLAHLLARYPGLRRHLERFALHRRGESAAAEPVGRLLDALDQFVDGTPAHLLTGTDPSGQLAQLIDIVLGACGPGSDVYDAVDAALRAYHTLAPDGWDITSADAQATREGSPIDWLQREARLEDWKDALEQLDNELQVEQLQAEDLEAGNRENLANGELRETDIDLRTLINERDTLARKLDMERSAIRDALGAERPLARSYRYDEWNCLERRYLRHYCRLFEEPLTPASAAGNGDFTSDLTNVMRRHVPAVLKRFEQIRPLGLQRVKRVTDGDELDLNAVIEARQDLRAGKTPDDRVYSRRERVQRDVCAMFLVDLSASTDDPVEATEPAKTVADEQTSQTANLRDPYDDLTLAHDLTPDTPRRRIIDVQRESMVVMAAALDSLGDSFGVYGFSGYGRDCVEFFVAKEPDQPFNRNTLEAIAGMAPKRSTRMGPAVRHATSKLVASARALKLLIILSDGFPQDSDYGPQRGDHEYGLQDTAKALEEAATKGVETFCVTVDRSGHDYLKRMCPDERYLVIEEIEDLPEALSKVYQALAGR